MLSACFGAFNPASKIMHRVESGDRARCHSVTVAHISNLALWSKALPMHQGRPCCFSHMRAARNLDPMAPSFHVVEAAFLTDHGRFAEALRLLERAFGIAPDLWLSQTALGLLQLAQAHTEPGIASLQRAATPARGTVRAQAVLATHLARFGYADEVTAFLT